MEILSVEPLCEQVECECTSFVDVEVDVLQMSSTETLVEGALNHCRRFHHMCSSSASQGAKQVPKMDSCALEGMPSREGSLGPLRAGPHKNT